MKFSNLTFTSLSFHGDLHAHLKDKIRVYNCSSFYTFQTQFNKEKCSPELSLNLL
jgi:hypothetical protein